MLCAYLRMPYQLPADSPGDDTDETALARYRERVQEREVRLAAQRLLSTHLRPGENPDQPLETFWPNLDLDLTGALLVDLDLNHGSMRTATFTQAQFSGNAVFDGAQFSDVAAFNNARFSGDAVFNWARFSGAAEFNDVRFARGVPVEVAQVLLTPAINEDSGTNPAETG